MSAADATPSDPETTKTDVDEEPADEREEDRYDFPMPGGLRGLV